MAWTVIVPPSVETAITGFVGAGEKTTRGRTWRAEIYAGRPVALKCDGADVPLETAPRHALAFASAVLKWWQAAVSA